MLSLAWGIERAADFCEVAMDDLNMPEAAAKKLKEFLTDTSWSWKGLADALLDRYKSGELADLICYLGAPKDHRGTGLLWYLKQLLPLTYRSHYGKDGKEMFCVWRMWFGKCFDIEEYAIGEYKAE